MNRLLLFFFLLLSVPVLGQAQKFLNLDFEKKCEESKTGLCFWDLSWGGVNTCKPDIGQPSWGLTTGNGAFDLADGARIMIASTRMANRNGHIFFGRISPDVIIESNQENEKDLVLEAAMAWIVR